MAAFLLLKVSFPYKQTTKMMKFTPLTLVEEVKEQICTREGIENPESFGLFCTTGNGFWLEDKQPIFGYELWNDKTVEFKKNIFRNLNIVYLGELYTVPIDEILSVSKQIPIITRNLGITNYLNFVFVYQGRFLNENKNFFEQEIEDIDKAEIILKKDIPLSVKKIEIDANKKKKKKDEIISNPIFQKPLHVALTRGEKVLEVPTILTKPFEYVEKFGMDVEGIYRKSGGKNTIEKLKDLFDKSDDFNFQELVSSPHDATGVFKLYLRELPEPPLTWELYDKFIEADEIPENWERVKQLRRLVYSLPTPNFNAVKCICEHMFKVSQYSAQNQMGISNLAMLMGPNLLRSPDESMSAVVTDTRHQYSICATLISEYEYMFYNKEKSFYPPFAKVVYEFQASEKGELTIKVGEIIEVVKSDDSGWWVARGPNKKQGLIPSSYVEIVPDYIPPPRVKRKQVQGKQSKKQHIQSQIQILKDSLNEELKIKSELQTEKKELESILKEIHDSIQQEIQLTIKIENLIKAKHGDDILK
ncbi:rho/rac/cdc gtpase-activating protein [Anaeramoeba ignava]|uniref:Rho/rac/cdc gtpase-activating protein n=1 Tax=Anaeramoeba ignava TaxID=1746090 RepID=A0A9Q0R657_ANAIG|nr:rho/rac/cdc gtpase-activating protein [Anaeramoeba ignava]